MGRGRLHASHVVTECGPQAKLTTGIVRTACHPPSAGIPDVLRQELRRRECCCLVDWVPELRVPTLAHGDFDLAADAPKQFTLISFYRGLHCPVCLKYLRELESLIPEYERRGTKVIAISSDVPDRAQKMASKVGTNFAIRIFAAARGCSQMGPLYFVVAWKDID
jgi:hypothetical protein